MIPSVLRIFLTLSSSHGTSIRTVNSVSLLTSDPKGCVMKRCRHHVGDQKESLLGWWDVTKRPLPWRTTNDPWAILLSEIILQQTQIVRGTVYWMQLIESYPTPQAMALATEDEVLMKWQGAGYYNRARRLHALAKQLVGGALPMTAKELQRLPGIGPYTAAAVLYP